MKMYFFIFYFFISATGYSNEFPVVTRLKKEKIRAVSCALGYDEKIQKFKSGKFNLALTWSYILRGAKPDNDGTYLFNKNKLPRLKAVEHEARLAKKHNLVSMQLIWFHNDTLPFIKGKVRKCITANGKRSKVTPCPQDAVYWQQLMNPLICSIAEIHKKVGCDGGVTLDLEFYTGDFIGGYRYGKGADGCYCDHCFYGFLKKQSNKIKNIPLSERYGYITKKYELQKYLTYLGSQVRKHVRKITDNARKIKKDFLFGFLMEGEVTNKYRWYSKSIIEAISNKQIPALIFSLNEYYDGYNQHSDKNIKALNDKNINALYLGGLTISNFNAEGLGAKCAELVQRSGGFWLYYGETLFLKNPKIVPHDPGTNEWVLRENSERYFKCMKKAMAWVESNPEYKENNHILRKVNLLTSDFFTDNNIFKVQDNAFINKHPKKQTVKIANSNFFPRPRLDWKIPSSFNILPKMNKKSPLCIKFSKHKTGGRIAQEVKVKKGSKLRFSMEICSKQLQFSELAFAILNAYNYNTYIYRPWYNTDNNWVFYEAYFKPDCDKIRIVILGQSLAGKLFLRKLKLEEVEPIKIQSQAVKTDCLTGIIFDAPRNIRCEVFNPETKLAYFKITKGKCNLFYLNKIYDSLPFAFQFKGKIAINSKKINIPEAKLTFSDK